MNVVFDEGNKYGCIIDVNYFVINDVGDFIFSNNSNRNVVFLKKEIEEKIYNTIEVISRVECIDRYETEEEKKEIISDISRTLFDEIFNAYKNKEEYIYILSVLTRIICKYISKKQ